MKRCVLCGNQRAEFEMRPLVNVKELALGNQLSEADKAPDVEAERKVGDSVLQIVCRACWLGILDSKDKATVVEMFETICGLLFEMERRNRELAARPAFVLPSGQGEIIEKKMPLRHSWQPHQPVWVSPPAQTSGRIEIDEMRAVGNTLNTPTWAAGSMHIDPAALMRLGDDWEGLAGCAAHQP